MAPFYQRIRGTFEALFQLGKSGPQLKNNAGVVEARDAADAAYAIVRGGAPAATNDLTTKSYVDSLVTGRARAQAVGTTASPMTTSATFVVIPEMTATLSTLGGNLVVAFVASVTVASGDAWDYSVFLDGAEVIASRMRAQFTATSGLVGLTPGQINAGTAACYALLQGVAAGSHTIEVRWARVAGTARCYGTARTLSIVELLA